MIHECRHVFSCTELATLKIIPIIPKITGGWQNYVKKYKSVILFFVAPMGSYDGPVLNPRDKRCEDGKLPVMYRQVNIRYVVLSNAVNQSAPLI